MTAQALLVRLTELDVHLNVAGQELGYDAPEDVLTLDLLNKMKEHKEELIAAIAGGLHRSAPEEGEAVDMVCDVLHGEPLPEAPEGVEVPAAFLLAGPTADLHRVISETWDDGELAAICGRIDDAYREGTLNDPALAALTRAVNQRAVFLQRKGGRMS